MPLDSARSVSVTEAIAGAVAAIGHDDATMISRSRNAQERAAGELLVAQLLSSLIEKRRDEAKRAAIACGVLPDYVAEPYPVGTNETVFAGKSVTITLKVAAQALRVDVPGLLGDLEKCGVKPAVLKRLMKKHGNEGTGAHIFTATVATR